MNRSDINYLTHTWNPVKTPDGGYGCTKVSPGCLNCWASDMSRRFKKRPYGYQHHEIEFVLDEKELLAPIRLKKPAIIGVQFTSDLFHEDVPDSLLDRVFVSMSMARRHNFIVLTKRPSRMSAYIAGMINADRWDIARRPLYRRLMEMGKTQMAEYVGVIGAHPAWPPPNVWLGVSVESQETAEERIPTLLSIPGRHWVSVEPMLGPIDLDSDKADGLHALGCGESNCQCGDRGLDWVVCGCESGPKHRPMDIAWVKSLRDQCVSANVPFWFKQAYNITNPKMLVQCPPLDGKEWKQRPFVEVPR